MARIVLLDRAGTMARFEADSGLVFYGPIPPQSGEFLPLYEEILASGAVPEPYQPSEVELAMEDPPSREGQETHSPFSRVSSWGREPEEETRDGSGERDQDLEAGGDLPVEEGGSPGPGGPPGHGEEPVPQSRAKRPGEGQGSGRRKTEPEGGPSPARSPPGFRRGPPPSRR